MFDEESATTDFACDRTDRTAFGFTRSEFEQHVTIEDERFPDRRGRGDPLAGQRRIGSGGLSWDSRPGVLGSASLRFDLVGRTATGARCGAAWSTGSSAGPHGSGWRPGREGSGTHGAGADGHHVDDAADCLYERRLPPTGGAVPEHDAPRGIGDFETLESVCRRVGSGPGARACTAAKETACTRSPVTDGRSTT